MKKTPLRIFKDKVFLTFIILIISGKIFCDVIIVPPHYIRNCIKITNVDDYPEISFIAIIENDGPIKDKAIEIKSNKCITIDRFSLLKIYAVDKTFVTGRDIKNINWSKSRNTKSTNSFIQPITWDFEHEEYRTISSVFQYFNVAGFTDTSVVIYKWREIYKFNTPKEDSVINYNYSGDKSLLDQTLKF